MSTYELAYLEENHTDGSVKHTYIEPSEKEPVAKPLDPNDAPVYEVIEDFLSQLSIQPSVLILRDSLVEQSITINCTKADDLPDIITTFLLEETSLLHYLYSIPSAKALIVGVELHRCTLSPDQLYRIDGAKIVKTD